MTMATNRAVREALLAKLGITRQALSERAKVLKRRTPMTTEDATYVIAHQAGIDIGRHLDHETLARVRAITDALSAPTAARSDNGRPSKSSDTTTSRRTVELTIAPLAPAGLPGMSPTHAMEAKRMAETVYPLLYVFENSARDLISSVLEARTGKSWWDEIAPKRLKTKAADRIASEGREAWHGARGAHPISYLDLTDLPDLVNTPRAWKHFVDVFPRPHWFDGVVDDMNVSRRVVAHMNPIGADDARLVAAGFAKWSKLLRARVDRISELLATRP